MGLRIGTNVASLTAQRNLGRALSALQGNYQRLASGRRIASAADDPAGTAMAARFRAQVRSLDREVRNAQDGVSLVQTAEGALGEIGDALVRMRELAVQAANGTLSGSDRDTLQAEFDALRETISQVASGTSFNGIDLLNGAGSVSIEAGGAVPIALVDATTGASGLSIQGVAIGQGGDPQAAMTAIDGAIETVARGRSSLGASQSRLEAVSSFLEVQRDNLEAARSRIEDVDVARETAELARNQILSQASMAVLAQANVQPQLALVLIDAAGAAASRR